MTPVLLLVRVTVGSKPSTVCVSVMPTPFRRFARYAPSCPRYISKERFSCNMKKICLITPALVAFTVTVADCVIEAEALTAAVAV